MERDEEEEQDEEEDDIPEPIMIHPQTVRRSFGK
jgi:hypothetical protein